jgi:signal transduction histidine kinase
MTGGNASGGRPGRRWLLSGPVVYLAILGAVAAGLSYLHQAARDRLDDALGDRLSAIAATAAFLVDGDSLRVWAHADTDTGSALAPAAETLDFIWLRSRLQRILRDNDLAEVTLTDENERVVISAAGSLRRGDRNVYFDLDRAAVRIAESGYVAASKLYRTEGIYQKSAHAPILAADGTLAGVLTVEGNADFFDALATLRRGAFITGGAVLLFLTVMGWLLYRLQAGMSRARAAAWRQENLAAMGRMTGGIAHEIRNPLGIIRGSAQHLIARLREAGIEDEVAGFIPEEVDRLDRILRGYLAFGTGAPVETEPVDLGKLARRTARLLEGELGDAGVRIAVEGGEGAGPVQGDPRRLQQVLMNLLLNARDAMPEGGTVTIAVRGDGDAEILTVADEGSGLGGAPVEPLFAPFHTTKEKGSGLGLAVVRQIVEAHGGTATLRDRTDRRGAVAEVRLPHAAASGAPEPSH